MKKNIFLILIILTSFGFNISNTNAVNVIYGEENSILDREQIFEYFGKKVGKKIPDSYKYINLGFLDVEKGSELYNYIQKLVYLDLISNSNGTKIHPSKELNAYNFYKLAEKVLKIDLLFNLDVEDLKTRNTNDADLNYIDEILAKRDIEFQTFSDDKKLQLKKLIFSDVYTTIMKSHLDRNELSEEDILNSAIEGLAKGTHDLHTVYFPPTENKNFYEGLNGKYEGIGSYVEMLQPGIVSILRPIKGSPSEEAGLQAGDIILEVDHKEIEKKHGLPEVISWIKGPAGTPVILTIHRKKKTFDIEVIRGNIVIKNLEYKSLNKTTFYIDIKSFGEGISGEFKEALNELKSKRGVKKVIIDLRNNGGGFLDQVSDMLGYFLEKGETTALVKYLDTDTEYNSMGYDLIDFSKYKIILLQNGGTASASEIMIGTIKDYYPDATIIGEKSYGKGSVQTLKSYADGSSFKFTIARWYTGKNHIGIDQIGIIPDKEVIFDIEKYKENKYDNQLNEALKVR